MATKKKASKKKAPAKKKASKKVSKKKTSSKKKTAKSLKTYVSLVLDSSGSMESIKPETINHFNEQLDELVKKSKGMDTRVALVVFNNVPETKFFMEPVDKLQPLTMRTYRPNGSTSMYDAVGSTIDKMEKELPDVNDENVACLVVVLSDGQENSSRQYSSAGVAERIQRLQDTKRWTFAYMGANQDLSQVAQQLHIPLGNTVAFASNSAGMQVATTRSKSSLGNYMTSRSIGETQTQSYYSPTDQDESIKVKTSK